VLLLRDANAYVTSQSIRAIAHKELLFWLPKPDLGVADPAALSALV
jgi:hypothetical protein